LLLDADFASLLRPPAGPKPMAESPKWQRLRRPGSSLFSRRSQGYCGEVGGYELSADSAVAAALAKSAGYGPQADG